MNDIIRFKRIRKRKIITLILIYFAVSCLINYSVIYSDIPIIKKWRTIYIETAMGTMNHHWLAEIIFPQSVIEDVMNERQIVTDSQKTIHTTWDISVKTETDHLDKEETDYSLAARTWDVLEPEFSTYYSEIDKKTLDKYLDSHSDAIDEHGYLFIDQSTSEETGIKTTQGDQVCVLDTRNGIVIVNLSGDGFKGKLALVKDVNLVRIAQAATTKAHSGAKIKDIAKDNNAILAVNASGFYDPNGGGDGSKIYGLVYSEGKKIIGRRGCSMKVISINQDGLLNFTNKLPEISEEAMQFEPILILNGKKLISGSSGWGLQPRSVIGQTKDGQILFAVIDGRQPTYSIGITLGELSDLIYKYGAYQACNLDGGSSSVMYYNGRVISKPSGTDSKNGRRIPNAWIALNTR